jgi:plasmid maintenance system antidote protein VapI
LFRDGIAGAAVLGVARHTLSRVINGQAGID